MTETLGGEISVTSIRDQGSTFRVRLMLSAIDRPSIPLPSVRKIAGHSGPRRTIVVVDDNEDHRELMREVLMPLDFVVLTAAGGTECLTLIEGVRPDLFLIDISMPGMNGWQLVTRLREQEQVAPIIMLSANIGDGTTTDTRTGHNDTLTKPFDIRQLQDKLAVHLELEWIYSDALPTPPEKPSGEIRTPGVAHVEELIRLGEIGYVRGIEAKLADLAKSEENQPFTEAVKTYVQAFDLAGYADFLQNINKQGRPAGE